MTESAIKHLQHSHVFDQGNPLAERNTRRALILTLLMMVAEITGGYVYNSMALLADGWHMSSHALALGLAAFAYAAARRYANDPRFTFGTWKIEILAGYTSALFLVCVAALMMYESIERLIAPTPIQYNQAIGIATIGLVVNLVCAWLLRDHHSHDSSHSDHAHEHHTDLNQRSAYLHVLADAATSVLAIIALFGGKFWGANWLDPAVGIAGSILVATWAYGLVRDTSRVLLDAEMDAPVVNEIREAINDAPIKATITDLHVWRVGKGKFACIVAVLTEDTSATPDYFRQQIGIHEELVHITVEVNLTKTFTSGQ